MKIEKITHGSNHHFFGFHDLKITSGNSGRWLALSVPRIDRPPMGEDFAEVITWDSENFQPRVLSRTRNYNFPQGARQQWLGDSDVVIVNAEGDSGEPIAKIFDSDSAVQIGQISEGVYCCDQLGKKAYTVDFGRLHRLGGYGHSNIFDRSSDEKSPKNNGIFLTDIASDQTKLLLSIDAVRHAAGVDASSTGDHFLTHLRLNPSCDRIAFLHRFRLADGGEETCLWSVGCEGHDLRLLARGFLSHFDWIDRSTLIIWGRRNQALATMRRSPLLNNPVARTVLPMIKRPLRLLLGQSKSMAMSYLKIPDTQNAEAIPFAPEILLVDGHPMCNPVVPGLIVTDTYPDENGVRQLLLFNFWDENCSELGRFRKLSDVPTSIIESEVALHLSDTVDVKFPSDLYSFTRSGLHCDLHPRWSADGKTVAFDSIHEGSRQIYAIDVSSKIKFPENRVN